MSELRAHAILSGAGLGSQELDGLLERLGHAEAIAAEPLSGLKAAGLPEQKAAAIASPDSELVDRSMAWLENDAHRLIMLGSDDYPPLLASINDAPPFLFVIGDPDRLHLPTLAIVGSRNPTGGGERNAFDFANHLAASGFTIASGLAQGIDTHAHKGALAAGGVTVAFLAHGIDRVYPAQNRELAHEIARSGALVSEFPLGAAPHKSHFPQRNRLISGVSLGTLVVEAARRSGSLITARLSGEQGREVFALPGSIHNPMSRGCHQLIRSGAKLVESADDIVAELSQWIEHFRNAPDTPENEENSQHELDEGHQELLNIIGHDPVSMDSLVRESGLTIEELSSMLLILELDGRVERLPGGQFVSSR